MIQYPLTEKEFNSTNCDFKLVRRECAFCKEEIETLKTKLEIAKKTLENISFNLPIFESAKRLSLREANIKQEVMQALKDMGEVC